MSTRITADNGIEIEVVELGLSVIDHEDQTETWARLTPEQRRALAEALNPASAPHTPGGQWTREEATSEGDIARIVDEVTEGDWARQDLVDALWAEVSGQNRRREDAAVAAFKTAWAVADEMGDTGNRVRRGLRAALDTLDHWAGAKNDR